MFIFLYKDCIPKRSTEGDFTKIDAPFDLSLFEFWFDESKKDKEKAREREKSIHRTEVEGNRSPLIL